jgi:hypothetical protein
MCNLVIYLCCVIYILSFLVYFPFELYTIVGSYTYDFFSSIKSFRIIWLLLSNLGGLPRYVPILWEPHHLVMPPSLVSLVLFRQLIHTLSCMCISVKFMYILCFLYFWSLQTKWPSATVVIRVHRTDGVPLLWASICSSGRQRPQLDYGDCLHLCHVVEGFQLHVWVLLVAWAWSGSATMPRSSFWSSGAEKQNNLAKQS